MQKNYYFIFFIGLVYINPIRGMDSQADIIPHGTATTQSMTQPPSSEHIIKSPLLDRLNKLLSKLESRTQIPLLSRMSYPQRHTFVAFLYLAILIGLSIEAQNDYVTIIGDLMRVFLPFAQTAYAIHIQQYTSDIAPALNHSFARFISVPIAIILFLACYFSENAINDALAANPDTPIVNIYHTTSADAAAHGEPIGTLIEVPFSMTFSETWLTIYAGLQIADILYSWIAAAYNQEVHR